MAAGKGGRECSGPTQKERNGPLAEPLRKSSGNPELFDISEAFSGCTSLESIPSGLFSNCHKLQYVISLFLNCSSVKGESPYDMVEGEKVHLYERAGREGYTAITSYMTCFGGCTGLSDYEDIPVDWK